MITKSKDFLQKNFLNDKLFKKHLFQNRELSNLEFHKRVLLKANDEAVPFFERLRFLEIFYHNIDEFFMTRVDGMCKDATDASNKKDFTKVSDISQVDFIFCKVKNLLKMADDIYFSLISQAKNNYFEYVDIDDLTGKSYKYLKRIFDCYIFPLISPQIIDKYHPFPFLKNRKSYVYLKLFCKKKNRYQTGIILAEGYFSNIIYLPDSSTKNIKRVILSEDLILHFADQLFDKHEVVAKTIFRVTRNSDVIWEKEMVNRFFDKGDMKDVILNLLEKRKKLSCVKLQIKNCENIKSISKYLAKKLNLKMNQVFVTKSALNMSFLSSVMKEFDVRVFPNLFYPMFCPNKPQVISQFSTLSRVLNNDVLLSFPYDSFGIFLKFLDEMAQDDTVVSIKITLYRIAQNSQIISILKKAVDNGKDVLAVVELTARFDEENNIGWATDLEEYGCKVIYGLEGYKVHAKILLITRKVKNQISYISNIGTGNYNETTSKIYTDLSLITCDYQIGLDLLNLFNSILTGGLVEETSKIISSPLMFKNEFLNLIEQEILKAKSKKTAQIIIKCNAISDMDIILKLIEASRAGVVIKLIVRGICCLLPDIKNYTHNIEVISIIGRFLEHSRIFSFGVGDDKKIFISSADLMKRNTKKRVEVICPIEDVRLKCKITNLLHLYLRDNVLAEKLLPNGKYRKIGISSSKEMINSQDVTQHHHLGKIF